MAHRLRAKRARSHPGEVEHQSEPKTTEFGWKTGRSPSVQYRHATRREVYRPQANKQ